MNYDEMKVKQGANMLNHAVTLVGQDQFWSLNITAIGKNAIAIVKK